jgi:hypothetical protein
MYFNDHNPPHFHVRYEEFRAIVGIDPLELREGSLPPRVLGFGHGMGRITSGRVAGKLDDAGD